MMDYIRDNSLVLDLPLYKLDGTKFKSQDAYGHLCTVTGALWRLTHRNFDGDDDINLSDPAALGLTALTILVWVNQSLAGTSQSLVSKGTSDNGSNYMFYCNNGQLRFLHGTGGASEIEASTDTFTGDVWTLLAVSCPGSTSLFYIHILLL